MSRRFLHWPTSYRVRLLGGYLLVVTLLAAAWAWSLFGPLTKSITEQQTQRLLGIVRMTDTALSVSDTDVGLVIGDLGRSSGVRLTLVGTDGVVLADSTVATTTMENHADRPEVRAALNNVPSHIGTASRRSATQGTMQLYVAQLFRVRGERAVIRASEPLVTIAALAGRSQRTGLILLVIALLASAFAAWQLATGAANPVARLSASARAMAGGDLGTPIDDAPGELGELSDALRDLSAQTRARVDDLQTEQQTLRTVLDGLQDAVFLLDGDVVRLANSAASRLFRAPFGGWRGHQLDETVLPAALVASLRERLGRTEPSLFELGPNPRQRWLRLVMIPLGASAPGSTLAIITDITEVRRLDSVRTDFVANASHELKTPTTAIRLLADSAATAAGDGDTEQALAFTRQIGDEADRLSRLVLDLLALSRLERVPEPGSVTNLRDAIALGLTAHRTAANAKGLALSEDASAVTGEDMYARADPTDIAVALDNLLDNAIAYTDSGSVRVELDADAQSVIVRVVDAGIGIPSEDLPRVFERFYRVDRARTRASGGTGLGLALVRNVVERSGGTVEIDSVPDSGTTVTLRFLRA